MPMGFLVFLWLRLCTPNAVGTCSISVWGTKILQATKYNLKKKFTKGECVEKIPS